MYRRALLALLAIALVCGSAVAQAEDGDQDLPMWDMSADPMGIPEEPGLLQSKETTVPGVADEPEAGETGGVRRERVYIRVDGARFYAKNPMNESSLEGTVTGIALAIRYPVNEEINRNTAIRAVFVTGDGALREGVFAAGDILVMEYAQAIEKIGENALRWYADDRAWPLAMSALARAGGETPYPWVSPPNAPFEPTPEMEFIWEPEPTPPATPEMREETEPIRAHEGSLYVQLNDAPVYANEWLTPDSLLGQVSGIALATACGGGDTWAGEPTLVVMFKTKTGLHTGFVRAADAVALDYQSVHEEILEEGASCEVWPLPTPTFEADEGLMDFAGESPAPYVIISQYVGGELVAGAWVELRAEVFHLPIERISGYRWKNNSDGEFREVPGVTGDTFTFLADESNTGCEWIVEVLLRETQSEEDE